MRNRSKITAGATQSKAKPSPVRLQVLVLVMTAVTIALVVFLGRQRYAETKKMAAEMFDRQQLILARAAAVGIERFLAEITEELSVLAGLPAVQTMSPGCLSHIQVAHKNQFRNASIRRLDKNGVLRFIYPHEGWRAELIGRDYGKEPYFLEAKKNGGVLRLPAHHERAGRGAHPGGLSRVHRGWERGQSVQWGHGRVL